MSTSVDDCELIRSFRRDEHAFVDVVRKFRPILTQQAARRLGNLASAEDAVQETFFRAYRAFERLDDDSRLGPWLHHILINVCNDEYRRRQREDDKTRRVSADPAASSSAPSIEDELGLHVDERPVQIALAAIPSTAREALTMRFVEERDYTEIARSTGLSEQNVRARVSRARQAMRAALSGVALFPVVFGGLLRRHGRTAAALERTEPSRMTTGAVSGGSRAASFQSAFSPAIDTANAWVGSAPNSVPTIAKAVAGVGAVAIASISAGAENVAPPNPTFPSAAVATADAAAAPAPDAAVVIGVGSTVVTVSSTPPAAVPAGSVSEPPTTSAAMNTLAPAIALEPVADATTVAPTASSVAVETTTVTMVPAPTVATTVAPVETVASTVPVEVVPTTTAVPVAGGRISVASATVASSGPRLDIHGRASVHMGGGDSMATLDGRLGIGDAAESDGSWRISGPLLLVLDADGSTIEVRLQGVGTPLGDVAADARPTSFAISGQYRASENPNGLATGGWFSGTIGAGSFELELDA